MSKIKKDSSRHKIWTQNWKNVNKKEKKKKINRVLP